MSTLPAGELRHKVTIERCIQTPDGQGGRATVWSEVGKLSVSIEQASAGEVFRASRQDTVISHMIMSRYTRNLDEKDRLVFGTRTFQIVNIENVKEKNRKFMISAMEAK